MKRKRLTREGWGFQHFPYYQMRIENADFAENTESGSGVRVVLTFPCRNYNRSEETR